MESTLSLKKSDLEGDVGDFLGVGRGEDNDDPAWDTETKKKIISYVKSGQRQFYFPPPQDGVVYEWSFLTPATSITIASGERVAALPDDFGYFQGPLYLATDSRVGLPLPLRNAGTIQRMFGDYPTTTGQPEFAAVVPLKGTSINKGQQFELRVYPEPDQDYTFEFAYYLIPSALDGTHPYVYGGPMHHETVLESCLSIAEQRGDDMMGVHTKKWLERLAASISIDRRSKPQGLGYNVDRSDGVQGWRMRHGYPPGITFDGVLYES